MSDLANVPPTATPLSGVVVVTGAARGMGASHARGIAAAGAHVCATDVIDATDVVQQIRDAGGSASAHLLDVADPGAWNRLVTDIAREHGPLTGLVNNAGVSHRLELTETPNEVWDQTLAVNLSGPFYGMKAVAPAMTAAGGGAIVNISSITGQIGYFSAAYAASKWGLTGLTKSAAGQFAQWGIRVNSVHPGLIGTDLVANASEFVSSSIRSIPAARAGTPSEVTDVVVFLLSPSAAYITGTEVTVDGGLTSNGIYHRIRAEMKEESS